MKKDIYYNYFNEKLLPLLYPKEEYRIETAKKSILYSLLMFLAGIFFAYVFIFISYKHNIALLLLPLFLFFMYACFIKSIMNFIFECKKYQKWLIENILPYFFEPIANFKFWVKNSDTETIINSKLFGDFEVREDKNVIFGIYSNVNIIISNTELILPVKSAIQSNRFKGTLIQLELPESIDNHIILFSKNSRKNNNYKQVNPHIEELNKYLYTFAQKANKTEIVSKEFWDIIKQFGESYLAKSFQVSIKDNRTKKSLDFRFNV